MDMFSRVLGMACESRGELKFLLSLPHPRAITEQKQKMKRLGSGPDQRTEGDEDQAHKAYENAVGILSRRLQEALAAKEASRPSEPAESPGSHRRQRPHSCMWVTRLFRVTCRDLV